MKKIIISLAGVLAATAFAPEASAIPAFARQTGMACQACHFQHFPLINAFGRSFKASGYTMMGAQGKVEGEHLSIPDTLNMSALATAGYNSVANSNLNVVGGVAAPLQNNSYMTPNGGGELSLFFGGRVSENIGFLSEFAFPDNAPSASAAKMPMIWDMGGAKAGLVLVANQRPAYSMELLNTGADKAHRLMGNVGVGMAAGNNHMNVTSAHSYLGTYAGGHGVSFVASGDMGFVNLGKYNLSGAAGTASPSNTMSTTYARAAYIFNAGGWDSAVGIQNFSGHQGILAMETKATIIDGQMQGEAGGMPLGIYASYGRAPASSVNGNLYTGGIATTTKRDSFNIAAELGVIPHKATLQLALRRGKTGNNAAGVAAGMSDRDNAIMVGGTYELAQNVELSLTHTANSGGAYGVNGTLGSAINPVTGLAAGTAMGKTQTTLLLEALF